jgi:hypothetical protein
MEKGMRDIGLGVLSIDIIYPMHVIFHKYYESIFMKLYYV